MRTLDTDDAQPLGPAKPRQEAPKPVPRETEVRPGIVRDSDGKLRTNLPDPPPEPPPIYVWWLTRQQRNDCRVTLRATRPDVEPLNTLTQRREMLQAWARWLLGPARQP